MNFNDLRLKVKDVGIFSLEDVIKWFPNSSRATVKNQLRNWIAKGYFWRLKKNIYFLREMEIKDEFFLANRLYKPSYVSLESALNYYGIIPDVPFAVTSVTTKKTQEFSNQFGLFTYRTLKSELFFGWQEIPGENSGAYKIAKPEKAIFDFLYLNQKSFNKFFPQEERFVFDKAFNWHKFLTYASLVKSKKLLKLIYKLRQSYD